MKRLWTVLGLIWPKAFGLTGWWPMVRGWSKGYAGRSASQATRPNRPGEPTPRRTGRSPLAVHQSWRGRRWWFEHQEVTTCSAPVVARLPVAVWAPGRRGHPTRQEEGDDGSLRMCGIDGDGFHLGGRHGGFHRRRSGLRWSPLVQRAPTSQGQGGGEVTATIWGKDECRRGSSCRRGGGGDDFKSCERWQSLVVWVDQTLLGT
jgi:hypothetical protein